MSKQSFVTGQVLTAQQVNDLQNNDFNQTVSAKTASYTLVAADKGTRITMSSTSATTITVNTSLFEAGDTLFIQNLDTGVSTITAGTATVDTSASLALAQHEGGTLYFTSAGVSTFFKSAGAAAGAADNYTLINSGGTALTGATAITVSGISGKNSLFIFTEGDVKANATTTISLIFNSDSGSNYSYNGIKVTLPGTVAVQGVQNTSQIDLGQNNSASGYFGLQMKVDGTNAVGIKPFEFKNYNAISGAFLYNGTGRYKGTSAISSVTITSSSGNFSGGTIFVFGA